MSQVEGSPCTAGRRAASVRLQITLQGGHLKCVCSSNPKTSGRMAICAHWVASPHASGGKRCDTRLDSLTVFHPVV